MTQAYEWVKPGIIGFSRYPDSFDMQDSKEFEKYLFHSLHSNRGKLVTKDTIVTNKNFYIYQFEINRMQHFVLLNSTFPLLAYASAVDYSGISFTNPVGLNLSLPHPYLILSLDVLNKPLHAEDVALLRDYEKKIIAYWNPRTVGGLIYNYWD